MSGTLDLNRLKPSQLLHVAVKDVKTFTEAGGRLRMSDWGDGRLRREDKRWATGCTACMAGAVLACREPQAFPHDGCTSPPKWMDIIDRLRSGFIYDAAHRFVYDVVDVPIVALPRASALNEDVDTLDRKWRVRGGQEAKAQGAAWQGHLPWEEYLEMAKDLEAIGL